MEALRSLFDKHLRKALEQIKAQYNSQCTGVIYIQPSPDIAEFSILNEDFKAVEKISVHRWAENSENINCQAEIQNVELIMKELLEEALDEGLFKQLNLCLPFRVMLLNDEFENLAELLLIDEEEEPVSENLLEDYSRELKDFYKKLMAGF
ncbi:MAG: hypothetical protein M0P23_07310 [Bacteroidales bacterium]|jgi:hypothetical protein|nr:hypothetical protein [Bacteroidales bacterium]MDD4641519.1 hypothetical protein [Bacteroidales bacterium]